MIIVGAIVIFVLIIGVFFVFTNESTNISSPTSKQDTRREFNIIKNRDGTDTLKVPYYGYMVTYPSNMVVDNKSGYVDDNGVAVATYSIENLEVNPAIIFSIDVDKRTTPLNYDLAIAHPQYGTISINKITVNGLNGYYWIGVVNAEVAGPKPVSKSYVLSLENNVYVILTEAGIRNVNNPHLYSKQEALMDKIVYSFQLLK